MFSSISEHLSIFAVPFFVGGCGAAAEPQRALS
jgi:hypothetical protein